MECIRGLHCRDSSRRGGLFVAAGFIDGSVNAPWHWHLKNSRWDLVEKSVEVCDGTPEMVEKDLMKRVESVKRFCPWKSYVLEEKK